MNHINVVQKKSETVCTIRFSLYKIQKQAKLLCSVWRRESGFLLEEGWRSFWEACGIYYLYLGHGWQGWVSFGITHLPVHLRFVYFSRGAWVAQSVKHLTLDLSSGPEHRVVSSSPTLGSTLGMEPTLKKKRFVYFLNDCYTSVLKSTY